MRRCERGESESGASADAAPGSVALVGNALEQHHKGLYGQVINTILYADFINIIVSFKSIKRLILNTIFRKSSIVT